MERKHYPRARGIRCLIQLFYPQVNRSNILTMARVCEYFFVLLCIINATMILAETEKQPLEEPLEKPEQPSVQPAEAPQTESTEHAEGSVCSYCSYCKFCNLCEKDCPCTKTKEKPNCHMCKYCKYCNLCSAVCDTVCLPGGFLDTVSSSIWNSLPTFDSKMKNAVDKDLDSVKDWIKEYL